MLMMLHFSQFRAYRSRQIPPTLAVVRKVDTFVTAVRAKEEVTWQEQFTL